MIVSGADAESIPTLDFSNIPSVAFGFMERKKKKREPTIRKLEGQNS